jgi:hypothetical protein
MFKPLHGTEKRIRPERGETARISTGGAYQKELSPNYVE